jgi:exopolysaccharide biosynthesis polyprenyl glycosylphosphotransferase
MRFFHCIRQKRWKFKAVIIGNSQAARKLARKIGRSESLFSYEIVGYVPLEGEKDAEDDAVVIPEEQLGEVCKQQNISTLIIVPEKRREKKLLELISKLFKYGCQIKVAGGTISFITAGIRTQDVYGEPLVDVSSPSMSEAEKNIKRLFDILLSSIALLVCLPFMGIVALLIKADSKGPVFYSQERVGYRQKPFSIYKFRSMTQTAEVGIPQLSKPGDMRITKIGRILRKYRIDELPQFWNIIKGDMSLVGPRPERPFYIEKITKIAPYYTLLHQVRPGLTSWGMVKFGYASTVEDMVKRCKYDLVYLSNMTLTVDLKIMIYTIKTVVSGRGV